MIGSIPPNVRNRRNRQRTSMPSLVPVRTAISIGGARRAADPGGGGRSEPPRLRVIEPTPKEPAPDLRDVMAESHLIGDEVVVFADVTRVNGEKLTFNVDEARFTICLGDRCATCDLPVAVEPEPVHSAVNNGILAVHYPVVVAEGR